MEKKFVPPKGVYYILTVQDNMPNKSIVFAFDDIDGQSYKIKIDLGEISGKLGKKSLSLANIDEWTNDIPENEQWMLVDAGKKLHTFSKNKINSKPLAVGEAVLVRVQERDTTYELADKMMLNYTVKNLFGRETLMITE